MVNCPIGDVSFWTKCPVWDTLFIRNLSLNGQNVQKETSPIGQKGEKDVRVCTFTYT